MLLEGLQYLSQLAQGAMKADRRVALLPAPGSPRGNYYLIDSEGKATAKAAEPPPRNHQLLSVETIGTFVAHAFDELGPDTPVIAVYYSPDGVVVVLDHEGHRLERAVLTLEKTAIWELLTKWNEDGESPHYSQQQMVNLLRLTLGEALDEGVLASAVRAIKALEWSSSSTGRSTVETGRQTYGADIEQAVKSKSGEIPEEIRLNTLLYRDAALNIRQSLRVVIEPNVMTKTFTLAVYPEEVHQAEAELMRHLERTLQSLVKPAETPLAVVLHGTP